MAALDVSAVWMRFSVAFRFTSSFYKAPVKGTEMLRAPPVCVHRIRVSKKIQLQCRERSGHMSRLVVR
ncbi:hypothetical protein PDJAM_G00110570 [Pangasius djambal]|uniref:Uncharacterized protein n=1 Tax=Pangasius djambal TaxID=1691987 RepID=A0ACC5Y214_9TELE|nr:hypothetical protein [Pangasius djambal]